MQNNIEEQRAAMRTRLEFALGVRLGFTLDEASRITGLSKKSLYNMDVGFKVGVKRLAGVDDLINLVAPLKTKSAVSGAREPSGFMPKKRGAPTRVERAEAERLGISVKEYRAQPHQPQQAIELEEGGEQ